MIRIEIPGTAALTLSHLVLDYNGTLAVNGILVEGVLERLDVLAQQLRVHVITADTYGTVAEQIAGKSIALHVIGADAQDNQKLAFVESLGADSCVAIGNGRNDAKMLSAAALGFCVLQAEGCCTPTLMASDACFLPIIDALDVLRMPNRLVATLRN